jgi:protein involved in polysaccharide export with SLBB domain
LKDGITLVRLDRTELTIDPLGDGLATMLATGDIVTVEVAAPRVYFAVEGAVRKPGFYVLGEGMKLTQAVALAGGPDRGARPDRVKVHSLNPSGKTRTVNLNDIEQGYRGDLLLRAGDRIVVPGPQAKSTRPLLWAAGAVAFWWIFLR